MSKANYDDFLAHHGITGMKWGKKNGPPYPLKKSQKSFAERREEKKEEKEKKKAEKEAYKEYVKEQKKEELRKKDVKNLTDQELRDRINRVKLEQEYKSLTTPQKKKGGNIVKDVLVDIGKDTLKTYTKKALKNSIESIFPSLSDNKTKKSKTTDLESYKSINVSDISNDEMSDIVKRISQEKVWNEYKSK